MFMPRINQKLSVFHIHILYKIFKLAMVASCVTQQCCDHGTADSTTSGITIVMLKLTSNVAWTKYLLGRILLQVRA